jgi:phosphoserine phosphatase
MTKIVLTRHGHVEGINPERFRGRTDVPLTEKGESQARAVAGRIACGWKPRIVYTSPMARCIVTGGEIAQACGVESKVLEDLNDLDYGKWQWKTHAEARSESPSLFAAWHERPHLVRFPHGDSLQDLVVRTANALRLVLADHPGEEETVVLVGHDSVNRALMVQLLDQPLCAYWRIAQGPCAINEIDIIEGQVRVLRVNETSHLETIP